MNESSFIFLQTTFTIGFHTPNKYIVFFFLSARKISINLSFYPQPKKINASISNTQIFCFYKIDL